MNQPSIFAGVEMEQMVFQINAAIDAGERAARVGAERFREAGGLLVQAKARVKRGDWESWVQANIKRSLRQVQRWMALAKSDVNVVFEDQWAIINGNRDDLIETDPPESSSNSSAPEPSGEKPRQESRPTPQKTEKQESPPEGDSDEPSLSDRLKRAAEYADKIMSQALKTREASPEAKSRAKDVTDRLLKAARYFSDLPVRRPFTKTCECGMKITFAVTEKDKWIALHEGKGGYEIINGIAVAVRNFEGAYKNHFLACSKTKQQPLFE